MNKDKLDDTLSRKVNEARIEPPSDMWERIASTLREQGLTAFDSTEATGYARPVPTGGLWRKRLYAAAAAAVLLLCAVFVGYRLGGSADVEDPAADNTKIASAEPDNRIAPETNAPETPAGNDEKQPGAEQIIRTPDTATATPVMNAGAENNTASAMVDVPSPETGNTPVSIDGKTQPEDNGIGNKAGNTVDDAPRPQIKPSDMRSAGGRPVYSATYGAEAGRRGKRAAPLAVALYAGNFGEGKTIQKNSDGMLRAASNNFMMYEMGPGETDGDRQGTLYSPVKLEHKFPLSFGVGISKGIAARLSVESGVTYSYLYSESETPTGNNQYKHEQKLHYLGIPVGVKYELFDRQLFSIYAVAGGLFEVCVSGQYSQTLYSDGISGKPDVRKMSVYGIQPSANVRAGAEFKMSKNFSLYLEPGVSYYFETTRQPENYRTENPINFSLKAGVRFKMN